MTNQTTEAEVVVQGYGCEGCCGLDYQHSGSPSTMLELLFIFFLLLLLNVSIVY